MIYFLASVSAQYRSGFGPFCGYCLGMPGGGLAKTDKEAVTPLNYRLKQEGSNETKNGLPNNEKPPKKK